MTEDEQSAFCREHIHCDTRQLGYVVPPDTSGVDRNRGVYGLGTLCAVVEELHTLHTPIFDDKAGDLVHCEHFSTVQLSIDNVCSGEAERVD